MISQIKKRNMVVAPRLIIKNTQNRMDNTGIKGTPDI